MNPISTEILESLLKNDDQFVDLSESNTIEFKSQFDWNDKSSVAKFCKTIAGMCNGDGGYIFFGIEDETKRILGVTDFDSIDPSTLTSYLNQNYSPSIKTHKRSIKISNKTIGVIYTEKYADIPAISTKSNNIINDGVIYYRYSAMTEVIKGTDLIHLLHTLKGSDNKEQFELYKYDRKRAARPRLEIGRPWFELNRFLVTIINKGERVGIIDIQTISGDCIFTCDHYNCYVEKEGKFVIHGTSPTSGFHYNHNGSFEILIVDDIETQYSMKISFSNGMVSLNSFEEIIE